MANEYNQDRRLRIKYDMYICKKTRTKKLWHGYIILVSSVWIYAVVNLLIEAIFLSA